MSLLQRARLLKAVGKNEKKLRDSEPDDEESDATSTVEPEKLPTIGDRLHSFVAKNQFADVFFLVGKDKERIPAHRMILAASSEVFRVTLYPLTGFDNKGAPIYGTPGPKEAEYVVPEVTPVVFKKFLEAIYTDETEISDSDVKELVGLASKYKVDTLLEQCKEHLEQSLSVDNALGLLQQGLTVLGDAQFGLPFIRENATEVFATKDFETLPRSLVALLLSDSMLSVSESELFAALVKWSESACRACDLNPSSGDNKRKVLVSLASSSNGVYGGSEDLLRLVRFPLMSSAELTEVVQPAGILTDDEMVALFSYAAAKDPSKVSIKWETKERQSNPFRPTKILNNVQGKMLASMFKDKARWKLIYTGSKDGLTASAFHSKCDNKGPTVAIMRSHLQNIFGGHTTQSWAGTSQYKADPGAFIFSLKNNKGGPAKLVPSDTSYNVQCNPTYGPTFGGGHCLYLASSFSSNTNYSGAHYSYRVDTAWKDKGNSNYTAPTFTNDLLGGAYNFQIEEMEVFEMIKSK